MKKDSKFTHALMKNRSFCGAPKEAVSEVTPVGGCERMWLRCGGVAGSEVIGAMSAK